MPAKKFYEIVKSLTDTEIRIVEDKNGVKISADRFDSRIQTLPREDFPTLPEWDGSNGTTLPGAGLKEMVAKTQFAITGEDTRYFLNGALFVIRPDSMSLVATDGHRLALVTVPRDGAVRRARRRRSADSSQEDPWRTRPTVDRRRAATSNSSGARTTCFSASVDER